MSLPPTAPQHSRNSSAANSVQESSKSRRQTDAFATHRPNNTANGLNPLDIMDFVDHNPTGPSVSSTMGNLADELADAFSDSGEEDDEAQQEEGKQRKDGDSERLDIFDAASRRSGDISSDRTETRRVQPFPSHLQSDRTGGQYSLDISVNVTSNRKIFTDYDGSEFGSESDLDAAGMPATLISKIDGIESLVRRGIDNNGAARDDIFCRLTDGLRELGSQSTVEGNASRLITAHTALATHVTHQTRQLQGLTFPLLSPLAPLQDRELIDEIIPLLMSLSNQMPKPSTSAFNSLTALRSTTSDLVQTLSYLSDSLHMSRQTTVTATRRLKSAKELVSEIRQEEELREEGERWLSRGNWSQRLASRECANVCGEVIGGFEDVCDGWRQRLLAQAELKV